MAHGPLEVWPPQCFGKYSGFWTATPVIWRRHPFHKKENKTKKAVLLTGCSHSMCSAFPKPVWHLFLAWGREHFPSFCGALTNNTKVNSWRAISSLFWVTEEESSHPAINVRGINHGYIVIYWLNFASGWNTRTQQSLQKMLGWRTRYGGQLTELSVK